MDHREQSRILRDQPMAAELKGRTTFDYDNDDAAAAADWEKDSKPL